ncbi:MAG: hypothetical protein AAGA90_00565 [Actinomycetota bacterium]
MLPALWEIIIPLILAVLLGIVIGWLMWRWRRQVISETEWLIAEQKVRTLEADLAAAEADRDAAADAKAQAIIDLDDARKAERSVAAELETAQAAVAAATEEKDAAEARVGGLDADLAGARAELDTSTATIATLTADLESARSDADTAQAAVDAAAGEKDAAEARAGGLDSDLAGMRGELDTCNATVATLTADLAAARSETEAAQHASAAVEADLAAARARIEELEGADDPAVNWKQGTTTLGTPGAAHKDDLKVVNGIGPKMEELLNGFGIQSWEQLAWLSADEVQRLDDALEEFPGRIERDEWVPQANDLIARFPDRSDRPTRATFLNRSEDSNPQ